MRSRRQHTLCLAGLLCLWVPLLWGEAWGFMLREQSLCSKVQLRVTLCVGSLPPFSLPHLLSSLCWKGGLGLGKEAGDVGKENHCRQA